MSRDKKKGVCTVARIVIAKVGRNIGIVARVRQFQADTKDFTWVPSGDNGGLSFESAFSSSIRARASIVQEV
jgi:hypothetical protein